MGNCFEGAVRPVPKTPSRGFKVCIIGATGVTGQSLSMLMAMDPLVWELSLCDLAISSVPAEGIAVDIGQIERKAKLKAYSLDSHKKPVEELQDCLTGCSLVFVSAGVPRNDRSTSEFMKANANIAKSMVEACAKYCPDATIGLIVNPVSSVVPAMAKLYEKAGLDPSKICGVTSLDAVRANKFVHEETGAPIERVNVPVVGGYSGDASTSILPILSQDPVARKIPPERHAMIIKRIQEASSLVVEAKKRSKGCPTLSMAYASARFGHAVLEGLSGKRAVEHAFVKSSVVEGIEYFSTRVTFGPKGVEEVHPIGVLTESEQTRLNTIVKNLQGDVQIGLDYARETEFAR